MSPEEYWSAVASLNPKYNSIDTDISQRPTIDNFPRTSSG